MSKQADDILSESEGSEGWDDVNEGDDEQEALDIVSLLDEKVFPDAASMLAYCKDKFGFDFVAARDRLGLDFYGSIKLVNFVRSTVKEGKPLPEQISEADISDERFMMPVLADDAFIMCLDDLPSSSPDAAAEGKGKAVDEEVTAEPSESAVLRAQLDEMTRQFANYRLAVEQTLDKRWHAEDDDSDSGSNKKEKEDSSQSYWEGYANHDIHETMLKDTVRTDAYRDFIYNNKNLFKGKVVLDIGCGTGILSMFCAKAGAAHVYAIDKSAILDKARENIFHNNLGSTITCLRGRIEDITLPVDKVDIIVSEWMGYCLLYEAMLPSVLFARDRYLKPDGLLVPSHATIFVAPVSDPEYVTESVSFWRDVYGFDMKPMLEGLLKDVRVQYVPRESVAGSPSPYALDLYRCTVDDLSFRVPWASKLARHDVECVDGFVIWFDNYFATTRRPAGEVERIEAPAEEWQAERADGSVAFTTGPHAKDTHWKQGFLMVEDQEGKKGRSYKAGDEIEGYLSFSIAEENARGLDVKIEWDGLPNDQHAQTWSLH
ncbi:hypothetical protein M406DRAFT_88807 [Cryphonectria parasitica EP155]|uniref:type I protein arginine methyltransferase n=1 Tax=Cryphonectria parasitica (strain ATCC 38755 / EP155) TaxID=660469 RepID=A0A9P4Y3L0_CRYP1|nr:uncharacterized protein M406DRAFT_88807 [Cryphonectria parasitica EP155]KAF3766006.1 hypothetical protein M406DRAFT_88807 [Cryphonectria parasitica EP155]